MKKRKPKPKRERKSVVSSMTEAGLDPKKEFIFIALMDLAMIALGAYLYVIQRSIYPLFSLLAVMILVDYFYLNRYSSIKKKNHSEMEQEFIRIFTYFSIYVKDGLPVYTALSLSSRFASVQMKKRFDALLEDIDNDKSLAPYMRFAEGFDSLTIHEVMVSIYMMVEEGGSSLYARQFEYLFDGLAKTKRKEENERKIKRLGDLTFLPVVASGFTMIILSYGIVGIIGGMTYNGI